MATRLQNCWIELGNWIGIGTFVIVAFLAAVAVVYPQFANSEHQHGQKSKGVTCCHALGSVS